MPEAIAPEATQARQVLLWGQEGASWNQEGAFYGQDACLAPARERQHHVRNISGLNF